MKKGELWGRHSTPLFELHLYMRCQFKSMAFSDFDSVHVFFLYFFLYRYT